MNTEELIAVYDKLLELTQGGKAEEAQGYLNTQMDRLPEELQKEILARAYFDALVEEAEELQDIADIQQRGLFAIEVLEKYIAELEKESG